MRKKQQGKKGDSNREKPKEEFSGMISCGDRERRMRIFLGNLHPSGSQTPQLSLHGTKLVVEGGVISSTASFLKASIRLCEAR